MWLALKKAVWVWGPGGSVIELAHDLHSSPLYSIPVLQILGRHHWDWGKFRVVPENQSWARNGGGSHQIHWCPACKVDGWYYVVVKWLTFHPDCLYTGNIQDTSPPMSW